MAKLSLLRSRNSKEAGEETFYQELVIAALALLLLVACAMYIPEAPAPVQQLPAGGGAQQQGGASGY